MNIEHNETEDRLTNLALAISKSATLDPLIKSNYYILLTNRTYYELPVSIRRITPYRYYYQIYDLQEQELLIYYLNKIYLTVKASTLLYYKDNRSITKSIRGKLSNPDIYTDYAQVLSHHPWR